MDYRCVPTRTSPWEIATELFFKDFFDTKTVCYRPIKEVKFDTPIDIFFNEDDSVEINIAAIGLNKEDIVIETKDDTLFVSYNKETEEDSKKQYLVKKICNKSFNYSWKSPDNDLSQLTATLDKGLLKIVIPKKVDMQVKKIQIN